MKDFRFKLGIATTFFYTLFWQIPRANRIIAKGDQATEQEKYDMAFEIVSYMRRHFKTKTYVFGLDNVPREDGFICMGNHQGKYDALCVMESMNRSTSVLWEKGQADRIMSRQICGLVDAVPIDLKDPHDIVRAIKRTIEIVKSGRNMIIFPEGGYDLNHNTLQEFNTGCFSVCLQTKAPILPFVLYDAYKSMNTNNLKPVTTQIHFLPPIPYEVYGSMKKKEIAEYLKNLIQSKLDEIEMYSCEECCEKADSILNR